VNQPADIKLISNAPVGVMNSSAAITTEGFGANTTGGDITIDGAMRDLIMTSVSSDSPSLIGVGVAGGDMLVLAGEDLNIGSLSKIFNLAPAGKVTLVADNYNPTSPLVGVGEFNLGSGASLSTASGSSLFIYTALDTQNHVDGTMNASPLILPIIPFVNTPDAQWGIYYPNNPNAVTGTPYTIFYKDHGTPPTPPTPPTPSPGLVTAYSILVAGTKAQNLYTISLGESFDDWSTYSYRPVYVLKKIRIEFPDSGKWRLPVWEYSYFYTSHRNYQTLKLDQRL